MKTDGVIPAPHSQIPESRVSVNVNGNHIDLVVVSPAFAGLTPVKKQQLVKGVILLVIKLW